MSESIHPNIEPPTTGHMEDEVFCSVWQGKLKVLIDGEPVDHAVGYATGPHGWVEVIARHGNRVLLNRQYSSDHMKPVRGYLHGNVTVRRTDV